MAELTPEEKEKIYEEEKIRLEAKQKLEKKKTPLTGLGCLMLIIVAIVIWFTIDSSSPPSEKSPTKTEKEIPLSVQMKFTGTQFIITNNDNFDWTNVKIEINSGILKGGYSYSTQLIKTKITYTIGAMQFTKRDGTRFDPFAIKPKEVFISADTSKGKRYYSGGWD